MADLEISTAQPSGFTNSDTDTGQIWNYAINSYFHLQSNVIVFKG
jgi:hypothetical protein